MRQQYATSPFGVTDSASKMASSCGMMIPKTNRSLPKSTLGWSSPLFLRISFSHHQLSQVVHLRISSTFSLANQSNCKYQNVSQRITHRQSGLPRSQERDRDSAHPLRRLAPKAFTKRCQVVSRARAALAQVDPLVPPPRTRAFRI